MSVEESMVSLKDIAKLLKKHPDTIYRFVRSGIIPGVKVGGEWRFFESKVLEHLNATPEPWAQSARSRRAKRVA